MKKLSALIMICVMGVLCQGAIQGPYTVDASTLHLWHLDEAGTPVADAVSGGKNMAGLKGGATLGNTAYAGFGTAMSPTRYGYLTETAVDSAVTSPFAYAGANGAFTFEAIFKLDALPGTVPQQNILSMCGNNGGDVFRFRLESWGIQYANTSKGEWGGVGYGDTSLNTTDWFHIAIAYNGRDGEAGNMKYYLTNMNSAATEAHLVGTGTHTDISGALGEFYIGNMGWGHSEGLVGMIDEVRISSVARGADEMIFVPEPGTLVLLGMGGLALLKRRRA